MHNRNIPTCKTFLVTALAFLPVLANAQQTADLSYVSGAVTGIQALMEQLIPLAVAIALLVFIWGLVQFIASLGDPASKEAGVRRMVWGIISLFVIVSVWGLVGLLNDITGIEQGGEVTLPEIPLL